MKNLFIVLSFLVSFNIYAYREVRVCKLGNFAACDVQNPVGNHDFGQEFPTLEQAQAWIAEQSPSKSWGELERTKLTSECTEDELANQVLETIPAVGVEGEPDYQPEQKRLKQTFTTVILDITQKKLHEAALVQAEKVFNCGKSAQKLILIHNADKNLTKAQVKHLVSTYADVKNLLDTGSLETAIEEIGAIIADGVVITEDDKTAIVEHINGCK